jgi:hypothetical protein
MDLIIGGGEVVVRTVYVVQQYRHNNFNASHDGRVDRNMWSKIKLFL